ncbi:MAG: DUF2721 domain-containing protein [Bauldia sp.]
MALADNPFIVLSYVGGPALLTNSTALLILSTSNRFGRAVDRSRVLAGLVAKLTPEEAGPGAKPSEPIASEARELVAMGRRIRFIVRALSGLYLAIAMFSLATLTSIVGGVVAQYNGGMILDIAILAAALFGLVGFVGLVAAAIALVIESRLAEAMLSREQEAALANMGKAARRAA